MNKYNIKIPEWINPRNVQSFETESRRNIKFKLTNYN